MIHNMELTVDTTIAEIRRTLKILFGAMLETLTHQRNNFVIQLVIRKSLHLAQLKMKSLTKMIMVKVIGVANPKQSQEKHAKDGVSKSLMYMMMQLKPLELMANTTTVEIQMANKNQFGATQQILRHHGSFVIQLMTVKV